jgi:hypothetical protein
MLCPPHLPWLDLPNDIWRWVQIMKFHVPSLTINNLLSCLLHIFWCYSMHVCVCVCMYIIITTAAADYPAAVYIVITARTLLIGRMPHLPYCVARCHNRQVVWRKMDSTQIGSEISALHHRY